MAEYRAIRNALPGDNLRINSTKSMIGHLLGAAGAVEAVAVVQAMQTGNWSLLGLLFGHQIMQSAHGCMSMVLTSCDAVVLCAVET